MKKNTLSTSVKKELNKHNILLENIPTQLHLTNEQICLFAEEMRKTKPPEHPRTNLIYRFLFEGLPDETLIEELAINFDTMTETTYVAIRSIVDRDYIVNKTYADKNEHQPISEFLINVEHDEKLSCYNNGTMELINKATNGKVTLSLKTSNYGRPIATAYSIKDSKENRILADKISDEVKNNNLYKNKILIVNYSHDGMYVKFIKPNKVDISKVIISDDIKEVIQENVFNTFQKADIYRKHNVPLKRGLLLEGPPGNGKSTIIKYLETSLDKQVTILYASDSVFSYGSGVQALYRFANQHAPSMVIIEDIDSVAKSREMVGGTLTSSLLNALDGVEMLDGIVTIATTNFPEFIDDALKNRPSRFDRRIKIPLPDQENRISMWKMFLENSEFKLEELDYTKLASKSDGFSGAMIREAVNTSKIRMISNQQDTITNEILLFGIQLIRENYYDGKTNKKPGFGFRNGVSKE